MMKEYDLINELGPKNWLDSVAGEAVVFGHLTNNPELVAKGTQLAGLIDREHYDSDGFFKVQAFGRALEKEILKYREIRNQTVFIDEIYFGKEKKKSLYEWEFDFNCAGGQYQIMMFLPVYHDKEKLINPVKILAEKTIKAKYTDPSFERCCVRESQTTYDSQVFDYTFYYDMEGKELRRTVDYNHEGVTARGWIEYFYFDDFTKALTAWQEVLKVFTSSQTR